MGHTFERQALGENEKSFVLLASGQKAKLRFIRQNEWNGHLKEVDRKCERDRDSIGS
jgi:hypothetical protein